MAKHRKELMSPRLGPWLTVVLFAGACFLRPSCSSALSNIVPLWRARFIQAVLGGLLQVISGSRSGGAWSANRRGERQTAGATSRLEDS
jgi:hypothetical protein